MTPVVVIFLTFSASFFGVSCFSPFFEVSPLLRHGGLLVVRLETLLRHRHGLCLAQRGLELG